MAINFAVKRCLCGGNLAYIPERKIWYCDYCGSEIEREATIDKVHVDGIEGIDDVVRQTLMDVANQKMDRALRNLEDCERKNHKHVGTIIAYISYNLANFSLAGNSEEARGSLDKVKIYAQRLKTEFPRMDSDEINLYESFGESAADIYANLMAVYDTLGDKNRLEYMATKLRPESVFSPAANKVLLKVSIKYGRLDVVDAIVKNIGHIDRKFSLQTILDHYPCNEKKAGLVKALFDEKSAQALGKKYFETYYTEGSDDLEMKCTVTDLINTTELHLSADAVVNSLKSMITDYDTARRAFDSVYGVKLSDQETEGILVYCLMENKNLEVQRAFFDTLLEKKVFVALNGRTVITFLENGESGGDVKADVLSKMLGLQIENKALDSVYNYYLSSNRDEWETREKVLEVLLVPGCPISANTAKGYIVRTSTDEGNKKAVIEKIFATGIQKTYLGDLLSEYLMNSADSEEQKGEISEYLMGCGFKADGAFLTQYAGSKVAGSQKYEKLQHLIKNGTLVKSDALEAYLLSIQDPSDFMPEIFQLLSQGTFALGFQGYAGFLFRCKDADKVRHNQKLLGSITCNLSTPTISATHCGNSVRGNVAQAYLLMTGDPYEQAHAILQQLQGEHVKLNTDVNVNGSTVKFKKYLAENKSKLSPLTLRLSEENRMFSLF